MSESDTRPLWDRAERERLRAVHHIALERMQIPRDLIVQLSDLQRATEVLDRYREDLGEPLWQRGNAMIRSKVWWLLETAA